MARFDTISFLSDYGRTDEFVGVVHSVIRQLAPEVRVIDVTHDVPAHDVRAGGLTLARSAQYLAPGVVLAVVDPGVGTARRAIAVEVGELDAGFVYATDARQADVVTLFPFDPTTHPPIEYLAIVPRGAPSPARARRFLDFLRGDEARARLAEAGFVLP